MGELVDPVAEAARRSVKFFREVDRGDLVVRTDQDWGEGMVLSVHHDEARVSWSGGDVVSWVPLRHLAFATWTAAEVDAINAQSQEDHLRMEGLIE